MMRLHSRSAARAVSLALAAAALALLPTLSPANDRPFQNARTAVAEDDDEATWSLESWVQRLGPVRSLSVEPEYTFTPFTSVQMELTRRLDRGAAETGQEAEIEFKHLFNHIGRDGYGWGLSLAASTERSAAEGTTRRLTLKLPLSIEPGQTGALLHLNAGVIKPSGERRLFTRAVAAEFSLTGKSRAFAEFARDGDERYAQIGVRHWLRRERLAVDASVQQRRSPDGERSSGFLIGVGWYDL
jgi:hypothetical protein